MTAWTVDAWRASFLAVGGTLSLHDGALVVGWLLTDAEQDRAAAEVSREIAGNPARIAAVRDLLAPPCVADDSKPVTWLTHFTQGAARSVR